MNARALLGRTAETLIALGVILAAVIAVSGFFGARFPWLPLAEAAEMQKQIDVLSSFVTADICNQAAAKEIEANANPNDAELRALALKLRAYCNLMLDAELAKITGAP